MIGTSFLSFLTVFMTVTLRSWYTYICIYIYTNIVIKLLSPSKFAVNFLNFVWSQNLFTGNFCGWWSTGGASQLPAAKWILVVSGGPNRIFEVYIYLVDANDACRKVPRTKVSIPTSELSSFNFQVANAKRRQLNLSIVWPAIWLFCRTPFACLVSNAVYILINPSFNWSDRLRFQAYSREQRFRDREE